MHEQVIKTAILGTWICLTITGLLLMVVGSLSIETPLGMVLTSVGLGLVIFDILIGIVVSIAGFVEMCCCPGYEYKQ